MSIRFHNGKQIVHSPNTDLTDSVAIYLQPTSDYLETLHINSKANRDAIWDYSPYPDRYLEIVVPATEEFAIGLQVKQVLAQGGRVLLLTPDSQDPQEFTLTPEA